VPDTIAVGIRIADIEVRKSASRIASQQATYPRADVAANSCLEEIKAGKRSYIEKSDAS
jgi:hypothetical protein